MVEVSGLGIINLKFLLLCFREMSGLTINFNKSEVLGYSEGERQSIASLGAFRRLTLGPLLPSSCTWRRVKAAASTASCSACGQRGTRGRVLEWQRQREGVLLADGKECLLRLTAFHVECGRDGVPIATARRPARSYKEFRYNTKFHAYKVSRYNTKFEAKAFWM